MFELLLNLRIFRFLIKLAFLGVLLALLVLILLYIFQNKLIYIPSMGKIVPRRMENNPMGYRSPSERGLQFRDVNIETSDGENLHGWFIYSNGEFSSLRVSISRKKQGT